jgi:hypothetical protein
VYLVSDGHPLVTALAGALSAANANTSTAIGNIIRHSFFILFTSFYVYPNIWQGSPAMYCALHRRCFACFYHIKTSFVSVVFVLYIYPTGVV